MSFGWLGTLRQGQWQALRSFLLNERRDVGRRVAVIEAELQRIGNVIVSFATTIDPVTGERVLTEERTGFAVSIGSSLEKLIQAYVVQGGNPLDISMFLSPDSIYEDFPTQPYGGVIYPLSGAPAVGTRYTGGYLVVKKYTPARTGGRKDLQDNTVAGAVDTSRRWVDQTIQYRIHNLEARILKLCDLREQLQQELEAIIQAAGGVEGALPTLDQEFYDPKQGVARTVASMDAIFYEVNPETGVPDFTTQNNEMLEKYPSLLPDILPEESNTIL
jgi:hypothetical protein